MSNISESELHQAVATALPPEDDPAVGLMSSEQLKMHAKEMMLWDDNVVDSRSDIWWYHEDSK